MSLAAFRFGAGEHDARAGVAVSRHGPAARTRGLPCTLLDATLSLPESENPACSKPSSKWWTTRSPSARVTICCRTPGRVRSGVARRQESALGAVPNQSTRETFPASAAGTRGRGLRKNILQECAARLNRTDARELATKPETWPDTDVSGPSDNAPRFAETLRCHCGGLLRAFGDFTNGPGGRCHDLQHSSSHALRITPRR